MPEIRITAKSTSTAKRNQSSRILVVDDDDLVRKTMRLLLNRCDYEVDLAKNGFEALDRLDEQTYGMVICEMKMPGISGEEMTRTLRRTCAVTSNRESPVLYMTGYYDSLAKSEQNFGLLDCIYKPFDEFQILQVLRIYFGSPVQKNVA